MQVSVGFLRKIEQLEPGLKDILYSLLEEIEKQREESVTKVEFNELKDIVKELALAQNRTEKKIAELGDAQNRTETILKELAEAQKRTEEELRKLTGEHRKTREQLGGLSMTVGYVLEDRAYGKLPQLLEKDYGIKIKEELKREYLHDVEGNEIEVNIFGHGEIDGKRTTVIGESKAQLSKKDVDRFLRKKIKRLEGEYENIFKVLITYMPSSRGVVDYVKDKGIALYYSYQFPIPA